QEEQQGDDDEEEEDFAGMEFIGRNFEGIKLGNAQVHRNTDSYQDYRPYRPYRRPHRPRWDRPHDRIEYSSIMSAEEANEMLRTACFEEYVPKGKLTMHYEAIPEELVWKNAGVVDVAGYLPIPFICPMARRLNHPHFEKPQIVEEQHRVDLLYKMICNHGIIHIEDLWKAYLDRRIMEEYPFNGFSHFHQFIMDRSHVFGMDQQRMVYNQNLLVSVAVLRYVHALYHGTPVINAPKLFKSQTGRLFYRAFLAFMTNDDLSFDLFFKNFPSIFEFDEVWKLRDDTVYTIPCAFEPQCLPRRDRTNAYVDRSVIFNGIGKVTANNIVKVKIQSEDTLRKDMPYLIGVPLDVVDDPAKYPVGTRVAFTGVRMYNGDKETVQGTRIELLTDNPRASDGTIDVFSCAADEDIPCIEESKNTGLLRVTDVRAELAREEAQMHSAISRELEKEDVEITNLFKTVTMNLGGSQDKSAHAMMEFVEFIQYRPYYYKTILKDDTCIVSARSSDATEAMTDLLHLLAGTDGDDFTKAEAEQKCTEANASLSEESRFTLKDLKEVIDYRKRMSTIDGKMQLITTVHPTCFWDVEQLIMMRI
ncbi:hypothetical protein PENTCL1PPCAC_29272, partial [Pristionchus entomophagus]